MRDHLGMFLISFVSLLAYTPQTTWDGTQGWHHRQWWAQSFHISREMSHKLAYLPI